MFSSFTGEGENSDRIFTKNGAKVKFMQDKSKPIVFTIMPAIDPNNPDKSVSYLPSILPDGNLSDWGSSADVYRGIGHSKDWKERCSVVSLSSVGEECPLDLVYNMAKNDPAWSYITDDGKFGDPNRQRAVIPAKRRLMFCNIYLPNETERVAHVGIFSAGIAKKLVGDNGLVWQPNPTADDAAIQANYLAAYANGDITSPQGAPAFVIEKGHDKGEMSAYAIKYALDSNRRVLRYPLTTDIMATRYDLKDIRSFLNILTAEQIVQMLIREMTGRSPAGYHEYALLKLALGQRFQIPEPPAAPGAMSTVPSGFQAGQAQSGAAVPAAQPVPAAQVPPSAQPAPVPVTTSVAPGVQPAATVSAQVPPAATVPPAAAVPPAASVPVATAPVPPPAAPEADAALKAAVQAGAAVPPVAAQPAPAVGHIVGEPVAEFSKEAFLKKIAAAGKGAN